MATATTPVPRDRTWLLPAGLIALSVVPVAAAVHRLTDTLAGGPITPANARFLAAPWPAVLHMVALIPYALLGALQFWPTFRRRHRRWHMRAGRALAALGLVTAVTGLWMTLTYPWPEPDGVALYVTRLIVGVAMTTTIVLALLAVRQRHYVRHGEWMLRAYAIGLGAGTQVLTHLPWFIFMGPLTETPRAVMMAAGWVINFVVAEWVIRRRRGEVRPRPAMIGEIA